MDDLTHPFFAALEAGELTDAISGRAAESGAISRTSTPAAQSPRVPSPTLEQVLPQMQALCLPQHKDCCFIEAIGTGQRSTTVLSSHVS